MADRASELRSIPIVLNGAGTTLLIAPEVGYRVSVAALFLSGDANSHVTFLDTAGNLLDVYFGALYPFVVPEMTGGLLSTGDGLGLSITVVAGTNIAGRLVYRMSPNSVRY